MIPQNTLDASVLEFDFTASGGTFSFQYVFASGEYSEYVDSSYNDVFAFFLDSENIALMPGTTQPVSINNLNGDDHPELYRNNDRDDVGVPTPFGTEFDGFTAVRALSARRRTSRWRRSTAPTRF